MRDFVNRLHAEVPIGESGEIKRGKSLLAIFFFETPTGVSVLFLLVKNGVLTDCPNINEEFTNSLGV
jgi:hypothetical protein